MFWFFAKMQLVLLLAVIAGACWYYFGGYAEEVKDLKTQAIELVRHSSKETNARLEIEGILITMDNERTRVSKRVKAQLQICRVM